MKVLVVYTNKCKDTKLLAEDMARYARTYAMPISEFDYNNNYDLLVVGFEECLLSDKELKIFLASLTRDKIKNIALFNMFYFSEKSMNKAIELCHKYDLPLMRETYSCKKKNPYSSRVLNDDMISGGRIYIEDMVNICNHYY